MRFAVITSIFAATALGAPSKSAVETPRSWTGAESGLHVRDVGYQGDGFYEAVFNETGHAEVKFTPFADVKRAAADESLFERGDDGLTKRAGTTCSGRKTINLGNLDRANVQLANNAAAQGSYGFHAWGWVHLEGETSYFCNYQANYLTYQLIIDMHTVVSGKCGQDGYGFDRRTNGGGANDLAVGRTWRGDSFCESGFKG